MDKVNKKLGIGHDIVPKILCLIAALILWIYVTQVETSDYEETFNGVTVKLENTSVLESERGLNVYSGHGNTINLTISGKKSDIDRYTSDNIKVYADVSEITEPGKHTVSIKTDLPAGLTAKGLSKKSIDIYVDTTSTLDVEIKPYINNVKITGEYELGELIPEFYTVSVTGPQTILQRIDYAKVSLNPGEINSTVSIIAPLEIVGNGNEEIDTRYLQLQRNEVKVTIPVYVTKDIPLSVDYKHGLYNDDNVRITCEPSTIQVKGDPKQLESITSINVGTIDEKSITTNVKQVYKLSLPEGVVSIDNIQTVNVSIEHIGTIVRAFSIDSIKVAGADKLKYEILTKNLNIRVRGPKAELDKITKDDIKASVNLSEFGDSVTGTITASAVVTISGTNKTVYAVGDYPVQIKVS